MTDQEISSSNFLVPSEVFLETGTDAYMAHSFPVAADFFHPKYAGFLKRLNNHPFQMHRKLWEFAYIEDRLERSGVLQSGRRGLCFGVGQELLPAMFAARNCQILATDGPAEVVGTAWSVNDEFSNGVDNMNYKGVIEKEKFDKLVTYETCDMNSISSNLEGFDFCWSACCLEHLGSLRHGLDFIINSLETLKPGGVACHTTELNLSSNSDTIESGGTVLYRKKDLEAFLEEVRNLGHEVEPIKITPMVTPIDHHVDIPPYHHNPHLKILLEKYVTTSVGITIKRSAK